MNTKIHSDLRTQIDAQLTKHGFATRIAEVIGKTPSAVSAVIAGDSISRPIANAIATVIGEPIHVVFPHVEQYQPHYDRKAKRALKRAQEVEQIRQQLQIAS